MEEKFVRKGFFSKHFEPIHLAGLRVLKHFLEFFHLFPSRPLFKFSFIFSLLLSLVSISLLSSLSLFSLLFHLLCCLSSFIFSCLLVLSRLLSSCLVSLSLSLFLCLSVPVSMCCCGVVCVWCGRGTLKTPVCTFKTSPCVPAWCRYTRWGVLNAHTGRGACVCVCGGGRREGGGGQRDTPTTHTTHNEQTHNTHRTRKVASSVLLTKICPRRVIT